METKEYNEIGEEIMTDWTTEDEIMFLEELKMRQETTLLKKYEKALEYRVRWDGLDKNKIKEWLLENT